VATVQDFWKKLPKGPKAWLKKQWFEQLSRFDTGSDLLFLNHGYAFRDDEPPLVLAPGDEANRHPIQLYDAVTRPVPLAGLSVLEVGCGRGGGADWLARSRAPRSFVASDLTANAIAFCRRAYDVPGLRFEVADAHALPFPDASFDVVLNLESSLLYDDVDRFFSEVERVLRPGGRFVFADYRKAKKVETLLRQLKRSGLDLLEEEDISSRVLASMERESDRKRAMIARHAPAWLRSSFERFAAVRGQGDREFEEFGSGARVYLRFVLRKPDQPSADEREPA
jgi:ubiquinone/menaquinone biosynthesis C-methylase UbiE